MADLLANLPPVPPSLKSIAPYLQRAEELRTQDPVIAYWCAYYAAQIGINLKSRDTAARDLLLALLGALEETKTEIGSNDAIHNESAGCAYVENFALKVFANADNEDRNVQTTRATAKKFLAAANFLEVLRTFPKSDISDSNEEKIRYAKWKAADIAKAFREGRKPAPGPPGWAEQQEELKRLQQQQEEDQQILLAPSLPPSDSKFHLASDSTAAEAPFYGAPQGKPSSPSSNIDFSLPASSPPPNNPRHHEWAETGDYTSEPWSTVAPSIPDSPRNPNHNGASLGWGQIPSNNWSESDGGQERSQEVQRQYRSISPMDILAAPDKSDYSPSINPPPSPPSPPQQHSVFPAAYHGSLTSRTSPESPLFPSLAPQVHNPAVQEYPYLLSTGPTSPPVAVAVQEDPVELAPGIIVKAQKHCRFAVSALNYDDIEQAKKELRAALALLGG